MLREELQELFDAMPLFVQKKLEPVTINLLERAAELDSEKDKSSDYYAEEHEDIMKEVNKVKYINDQWKIMNARDTN
ncbi:hypothetical protein [Flavobacterium rhizosphaerae]|uniref:Addiction module component n=1 Tax=Flavobacterium rhizosphaerae TaxID=3163298 RepID=A0ABW8YSL0_9FLAO